MKKQQIFYIHGGGSYTNYDDYIDDLKNYPLRDASDEDSPEKWPKKLRRQLGEQYRVFMPEMPNDSNANYEEWKIWFERHFQYLEDNIILVGWSLGGAFLAKYLAENTFPFKSNGLFLLAAPHKGFVSKEAKQDGGNFYADLGLISNVSKQVRTVTIMHSKDDFVVPYEHALKYKEALPEAELVTFEDKNHFLVEELLELVERIKAIT